MFKIEHRTKLIDVNHKIFFLDLLSWNGSGSELDHLCPLLTVSQIA